MAVSRLGQPSLSALTIGLRRRSEVISKVMRSGSELSGDGRGAKTDRGANEVTGWWTARIDVYSYGINGAGNYRRGQRERPDDLKHGCRGDRTDEAVCTVPGYDHHALALRRTCRCARRVWRCQAKFVSALRIATFAGRDAATIQQRQATLAALAIPSARVRRSSHRGHKQDKRQNPNYGASDHWLILPQGNGRTASNA